jgi:hypothetical protein
LGDPAGNECKFPLYVTVVKAEILICIVDDKLVGALNELVM